MSKTLALNSAELSLGQTRRVDVDLSCACEPALSIADLAVRYSGELALQGVNLAIEAGQITALVGPSGCGKTTFLSALNRLTDLLPGCEVTGEVRLGDINILDSAFDVAALRRCVGMIFQQPNPFPMSIRRNIELGLIEHGMRSKAQRQQRVEEVLRQVGLWDEVSERLNSPALKLSGGQQQRLCIARAIALQPKVLLMDEPCSALDPLASAVVEDLITQLRGQYTVVMVTHNLAQARRLADHVALFWYQDGCGQLVESGSAEKLFSTPENLITAAYLAGERG